MQAEALACTQKPPLRREVTCNKVFAINERYTRSPSRNFPLLDGTSITHKWKKSMSNNRNEGLAHNSSFAFCAERLPKTFDRRRFVIAGAGGIAASMVAPSLASTAANNPVVKQNGIASIRSGQNCTWNTANGQISTISIVNSSKANVLSIVVAGAPISGITVQVNGKVQQTLNGIFTLPPNSPSYTVVATGNFGGAALMISNITNPQNDASAYIECVT
jgi:hypothetical protein